jgi:AcrR family transcriptional regulator
MPSTTRRPSATSDRRAAVEAAVIAATERLLAGGVSFTELAVGRIAAEAGISRPTFYLYFRDKSDLLLRMTETLGASAFEITEDIPIELESITRVLAQTIAFYRERAHLLAAVTEVAAYEPAVRQAWDAVLERFVARAADWLRAEKEAGRTAPDLDPHTAAEVTVWGGIRVITRQVTTRGPETDELVARELAANQYYGAYRRPGDQR